MRGNSYGKRVAAANRLCANHAHALENERQRSGGEFFHQLVNVFFLYLNEFFYIVIFMNVRDKRVVGRSAFYFVNFFDRLRIRADCGKPVNGFGWHCH